MYLINKPHIKFLTVISEIHQFHLHFSHGVLLVRSLKICMGCFSCAFGSYFHVQSSYKKTLKTLNLTTFFKPRFFPARLNVILQSDCRFCIWQSSSDVGYDF